MRRSILLAMAVTAITSAVYPMLERMADAQRGYDAFGGEEFLLIFGGVVSIAILWDGYQRERQRQQRKKRAARRKANHSLTESEQSKNHFDAPTFYQTTSVLSIDRTL